jgi:uncharacterized membrane protein YeaQ/YmgE (transglycosylase-associated protein family)
MQLIWWIIVGLIAGWVTGKLMRGSGFGAIGDILIGIAGAIVGGAIMRAVGFRGHGGMLYTILVAIGGAVVLTWLYRLLTKPRGRDARLGTGQIGRSTDDKDDSDYHRAA